MPEQPARSWSRSEQEPVPSPPIEEPIEQTELPGAKQVVLAARVLKVAGGVAIVGVIAHLVRTLLRLRR